jgi:protein SCO1
MRPRLKDMAIAGIAVALVASVVWVVSAGLPPSLKAASIMSEVIPPGSTAAPDFALPDQDGRMISLRGQRGHVVAVTFLNSHCTDLCPVEAEQLATAQAHLGRATPFVLLVVSVAPDLDTPASVRSFAQSHHWATGWHWLLGSQSQLAPVWLSYFIDARLNPTAANADNVAHSGALYLIDRSGYERVGFGLNFPPQVIEQDIRALAAPGWTWPWIR